MIGGTLAVSLRVYVFTGLTSLIDQASHYFAKISPKSQVSWLPLFYKGGPPKTFFPSFSFLREMGKRETEKSWVAFCFLYRGEGRAI